MPDFASAQLQPDSYRDRPELRRGETVLGRSRPELDATGIHAGAFTIYPELIVEEQFTDNVFATKRAKRSDQVTVFHPRVVAQSNWSRHFLQLQSRASVGVHIDETDEDYEDHRHFLNGRIDLARDFEIRAWTNYEALHQARRSADDTSTVRPSEYDILTAGGEIRKGMGKINLSTGAQIEIRDYDDNVTGLGVIVNQDDRDRERITWNARVGYEIIPDYEAFVRGAYNTRNYDDSVDDAGIDRDSHGYEVTAGLEVDFGGLVFGDFYGGFLSQNADDPSLNTVSGPTFGAGLTWIPTGLTSVRLDIERHIEETTLLGAAGVTETNYSLTVDHELMRNLLVQFDTRFSGQHFKGLNRDDDAVAVSLHANYLMNRRINLFLGYTFEKEMSDVNTQDFERNLVKIRFVLKI